MLKLARRAKGHFMTLIEIRVHLIRCKPGHISKKEDIRIFTVTGEGGGRGNMAQSSTKPHSQYFFFNTPQNLFLINSYKQDHLEARLNFLTTQMI